MTLTSHDLKFGVDISYMPYQYENTGNPLGTYSFTRDQFFNPNDPASIAALTGAATFSASLPPVTTEPPELVLRRVRAGRLAGARQRDGQPRAALRAALRSGERGPRPVDFSRSRFRTSTSASAVTSTTSVRARARHGTSRATAARSSVAATGCTTATCASSGNLTEFRNYQQFSVNITNPSYPDPYGGRDPLSFIVSAPANITVVDNDYVQPYSNQFNAGVSQQLFDEYALHVDAVVTNTDHDRKILDINARVPGAPARPESDVCARRSEPVHGQRPLPRSVHQVRQALQPAPSVHGDLHLHATPTTTIRSAAISIRSMLDIDWGPSNGERRHAVVASGSVLLPCDVSSGAVWSAAVAACPGTPRPAAI